MSNPPRSTFRVSHVSPVETRSHSRVRVIREGGSTFNLSLPMLHEIDEWALRQSPQVSRV
jgi:hypothetical protein